MIKVEAVVVPDRVEIVIDAVEDEAAHVGVTAVETIGYGRQRDVPQALLTFRVPENKAEKVVSAICEAARSGHESGDGLVWASPVSHVRHNRTGQPLHEYVEPGYVRSGV
ncbi:MAG TPA: P-II family nitrogen regulator [Gaiellaceae bacterium]|jgi:nitrogen regulatory protein PII